MCIFRIGIEHGPREVTRAIVLCAVECDFLLIQSFIPAFIHSVSTERLCPVQSKRVGRVFSYLKGDLQNTNRSETDVFEAKT